MSFTLKLDFLSNDLKIKKRKFQKISGSEEVSQRIRVTLWHHQGEYFLNREGGIDWTVFLGKNFSRSLLINTVSDVVSSVPGVNVIDFIGFSKTSRRISLSIDCRVQKGLNEVSDGIVTINGISVGE